MIFVSKKSRNEKRVVRKLVDHGFDDRHYLSQCPHSSLNGLQPVVHFHRFGWRQGLDPTTWFSTIGYLDRHRDVRDAKINPFLHYVEYGKNENRLHTAIPRFTAVDEGNETQENQIKTIEDLPLNIGSQENIDNGIDAGRYAEPSDSSPSSNTIFADGKSEWLNYGILSECAAAAAQQPGESLIELLDFTVTLAGSDAAARVMSARKKSLAVTSKRKIEKNQAGKKIGNGVVASNNLPDLSIIIPCFNESTVTAECLISIFNCSDELELEIILVNNGSHEIFFEMIKPHPNIQQIDLEENIGFGPAVNLGVNHATADHILLLNNDTQISPGALSVLFAQITKNEGVGIVGPKLISFDGRLQEAGVLLNGDGTASLVGFGARADEARFNYPRDVEHLSAACWLMRRDVFTDLGGFDPVFAPAYCEDADFSLKLRSKGLRLRYEPRAIVAHHLSKTTNGNAEQACVADKQRLVTKNRATLVSRWSRELLTFDIRTIAFYLPQYHPIPENDLWWGKGFTEWRNLSKAQPNFVGHRQPRRPADLGYYDLRVEEVMEQQAALALRYGVSGFCYYYYRFGNKRLLEAPIERALKTGKPDIPFCLCWANEHWSRRWDGLDEELLMEQSYDDDDAVGFAKDIARHFRDKRYIRVNDRPLILFYRLQEIPNPKHYVTICRNVWNSEGFDDVIVAMVESFELSPRPQNPKLFGADITVEFPAHGMVHDAPQNVARTNDAWIGNAHDYRELCSAFMTRSEPGFKRIRSLLVGWDTTPRHKDSSFVLLNSTPGAFQAWLEWTYQRTREQNYGDERIVFINAWNEWCEGSYLEPDSDYGHAYLQAVKNAQESMITGGGSFVEIK